MTKQVRLFGFDIDAVRMPEAVERVIAWVRAGQCDCRYVVTPNVDHAVMFQENQQLRAAYDSAALVLADGWPVVLASRLLRKPVPERVAGSDLVPALFDAAQASGGVRVYLLGAAEGVADTAAQNIRQRWPAVEVVGTYSPPMGFEHDQQENEAILERVAAAKPDVLVIGLGAPKQELWVHAHRETLQVPVALCVGATIDFLAGNKSRAPRWMQRTGLEWLHRLGSDPRRLAGRYARDAWHFPQLVWNEWRSKCVKHSAS
jgi:N-acetylglucosaminyldiphosphoundecaprenol N-acetyl-beta-D-mannosaminyltransferase